MKETDFGVRWFDQTFYPRWRVYAAARYEDGVLPRLRKDTVTLFTPWGPRYSYETRGVLIEPGHKELHTIERLSTVAAALRTGMSGKTIHWIFLGADLYGTGINGLPAEVVSEYFAELAKHLTAMIPGVEFCLWSELAADAEPQRQEVRARFDELVSAELLERAMETARLMGRGGDARTYLIERITEAMFMEELLAGPIKVSCAPKHKDTGVDGTLPCLYLVPEDLQAPWL